MVYWFLLESTLLVLHWTDCTLLHTSHWHCTNYVTSLASLCAVFSCSLCYLRVMWRRVVCYLTAVQRITFMRHCTLYSDIWKDNILWLFRFRTFFFSTLTLMVGREKGHPTCRKYNINHGRLHLEDQPNVELLQTNKQLVCNCLSRMWSLTRLSACCDVSGLCGLTYNWPGRRVCVVERFTRCWETYIMLLSSFKFLYILYSVNIH